MRAEQGPVTVLVAVASRHGATMGIGQIVGEYLQMRGIEAVVRDVADVRSFVGYDAVIVGSAVYRGRWLKPARQLAERLIADGGVQPIWLFSSGPIGDPAEPAGDPASIGSLLGDPRIRGHRVFAGKLDLARLGPFERLTTKLLHTPEGDYRHWADVESWAQEIADALTATGPQPGEGDLASTDSKSRVEQESRSVVTSPSASQWQDFSIRPLAPGPDPGLDAFLSQLGERSVCPKDCWRATHERGQPATRDAWAIALESHGNVIGAAWSDWPGSEGGPSRLTVAGSLHSAGEQGLAALLRAAHTSAVHAGQERLWICVQQDQPSLAPLLESAGFRVHSSFGYGGVTEVTLDVLPEESVAV